MNDHLSDPPNHDQSTAPDQNTVRDRGTIIDRPPLRNTIKDRGAVRAAKEVALLQPAQKIQIVCADSGLAAQYRAELALGGELRPCAIAASPAEAHRLFQQSAPLVTLLDASAVPAAEALEPAVALLAEAAPVVVVAAPERQQELAFLMLSGAADFVPRSGSFVSIAAARVERRVRLSAVVADLPAFPGREFAADFGEIFRHELNNEMTGILGNAELLLVRRDRLPPDAVERLQTIAHLAVRVRETVRRLSHAWDLWQRQPRSSPSAPPPVMALPVALASPGALAVAAKPAGLTSAPAATNSPAQASSPSLTNQWRSNDARRSSTRLASVPRIPPPQLEPEPPSPDTRPGAVAARWDRTWRTRKG